MLRYMVRSGGDGAVNLGVGDEAVERVGRHAALVEVARDREPELAGDAELRPPGLRAADARAVLAAVEQLLAAERVAAHDLLGRRADAVAVHVREVLADLHAD